MLKLRQRLNTTQAAVPTRFRQPPRPSDRVVVPDWGSVGAAGQVNYSASKSGLVGMARSFARELGSRGITANVIAPGFVETDMTSSLDEKRRSDIAAQVPLGRFCSAEEIAEVVSFIASSKASYITGAIIPVDGGLGMGH